jgi:CRISPR/Cas system CSM-associated protein Csm3 (group 7 of RAMP superfamily)
MKTIRLNGILTALSPIHHGGNEKTGSTIGFRRIDMITKHGVQEVPIIEGNAIRGKLRRLFMKDFLDRLGYELKTPRMYHFFYSGGTLEQVDDTKDSGVLNIDLRKQIRQLFIPIAIYGTSYLNQTFTGKLKVMKAIPICQELDGIIYDCKKDFTIDNPISFYELLSSSFQTRLDELKADRIENEDPTQMLIEYEVLIPGTQFNHAFILEDPTKLEEACFSQLLQIWLDNTFIGGKSSIGFGELRGKYNEYILKLLEPKETYYQFLDDNKEKIITLLTQLDQQTVKKEKNKNKGEFKNENSNK